MSYGGAELAKIKRRVNKGIQEPGANYALLSAKLNIIIRKFQISTKNLKFVKILMLIKNYNNNY